MQFLCYVCKSDIVVSSIKIYLARFMLFCDVSLYRDSEAAVRAVAMQKEGPGFSAMSGPYVWRWEPSTHRKCSPNTPACMFGGSVCDTLMN